MFAGTEIAARTSWDVSRCSSFAGNWSVSAYTRSTRPIAFCHTTRSRCDLIRPGPTPSTAFIPLHSALCTKHSALSTLEPAPRVGVRDVPVRHQADIQVREHDPDEAAPGPQAVVHVPDGHPVPDALASAVPGGAAETV